MRRNNHNRLTKLGSAGIILLVTLTGCNMYVVDFENRLPDGAVLQPKVTTPPPPPPAPPEPLEGSKEIAFMDSTTAQLEGCRVITNVNLSHKGKFSDGLVLLRNTALQINANRMIPVRITENPGENASHNFRAKLVRCPIEEASEDNGVQNG